ncbi:hypothetical protein CRYUN_Cryun32bG0046200 [Craigia yunnanensis]
MGFAWFLQTSRFAIGFTPLQPKPLDSILDLDRAKNRSPEDLASIWDDYHLGRCHIGLTMKAKLYRLLEQRGSDCRYFVIPLWRGSGYTAMFSQVQLPHMLFTGLDDNKERGTQAAPYFSASFYTEFAENKDLENIEIISRRENGLEKIHCVPERTLKREIILENRCYITQRTYKSYISLSI